MTGAAPSRWRWLAAALLTAPMLLAAPAAAQQPGVTVSATALGPLTEDVPSTASATYTVVLNAATTGTVMLTVTSNNAAVVVDTDATPRTRELTFTTMNWATAQPVTATATSDLNAVDERVTLTHALTGAAEYMGITVASVTVQVTDNEDQDLTLSASNLAVTEGASAAYTVRLATEPSGNVAVQVSSDNPDVAMQAAGQATAVKTLWLIFSRGIEPNAWNTAQPVTVHALTDTNTANESVMLTHTATGGDYGTVTKTLTVDVTDSTMTPVDPPGDVMPTFTATTLPAHTYKAQQQVQMQLPSVTGGDPPLTYTLTPTLPAGLSYEGDTRRIMGAAQAVMAAAVYTHTVTDSDGDTASQTVSITIQANPLMSILETQEPPEYREGQQYRLILCPMCNLGVADLIFAVTPSLPPELSYTLPMLTSITTEGVTRSGYENGGRITGPPGLMLPNTLFRLTVTGADGQRSMSFRLRQNQQPRFEDERVWKEYRRGAPIPPLTLPAATGGDLQLTYMLEPTPPLPVGLSYDPPADATSGGSIAGTPTTPMARREYTLTVKDEDGDTDSITFSIEVKAAIQSRDLVLVLAGIGRTLATDAVEILGGRFSSSPASRLQVTPGGQILRLTQPASSAPLSPSSLPPSPLAGEGQGEGVHHSVHPNRHAQTPEGLASPLRLQPISVKDLLARSAFELPLTPTGDAGLPAWTLWGRGSVAGFSGQPEDSFTMDGTLYSGYVGVDYRPQSTVLLGLAVSHSTGEVSYKRTGATKAGADVELTSVLPYAHWQPRPGLGLWTLLGAGWGDLDLKLAEDTQTRSTSLTSWLGAVGGRQALTTWQGIDLAAKTDAFLTTVRAAGTTEVPTARGHA